eukprot:5474852-Pyramimonas_sp.AAC.1
MAFHSSRIDVTGAQVSGMTIVQYLELFKCSQFTESGVRTERSKRRKRGFRHLKALLVEAASAMGNKCA